MGNKDNNNLMDRFSDEAKIMFENVKIKIDLHIEQGHEESDIYAVEINKKLSDELRFFSHKDYPNQSGFKPICIYGILVVSGTSEGINLLNEDEYYQKYKCKECDFYDVSHSSIELINRMYDMMSEKSQDHHDKERIELRRQKSLVKDKEEKKYKCNKCGFSETYELKK